MKSYVQNWIMMQFIGLNHECNIPIGL